MPVLVMVDDDEEDVYLTKRAFKNYYPELVFYSVADGSELFDYLDKHGDYKEIPPNQAPAVVLLDINIPRENGVEMLKRLKDHPDYMHLPVVMLTTSTSENDVRKAYGLGASSYICKSVNAVEMKKVAEKFCDYWFGFAKVPAQHDKFLN